MDAGPVYRGVRATKDAEDIVIFEHAVGITLRGSGLKIDVAPVQYEGALDDRGYLITRQGDRVLTSVTLHLAFISDRRPAAGPNYRELIRLLKAWIREAKRTDADLRCKSFLLELIVAYLWDQVWNGEPLAADDYPRAFEQVLGYIARTGLCTPVIFTDFYKKAEVTSDHNPIQAWDPVIPANKSPGPPATWQQLQVDSPLPFTCLSGRRAISRRPFPPAQAVDIASGTGLVTPLIAQVWPGWPGWTCPAACWHARPTLAGSCAAAVVIGDGPLFAAEAARVMAARTVLVWSQRARRRCPFFMPVEVLAAAMTAATGYGRDAACSQAHWGSWAVLRPADPPQGH